VNLHGPITSLLQARPTFRPADLFYCGFRIESEVSQTLALCVSLVAGPLYFSTFAFLRRLPSGQAFVVKYCFGFGSDATRL
jgi:hypothetical protein